MSQFSSPGQQWIYIEHDRFHNVWEFWAYNVVFGLFQAPYYAFSQTMMAELTPPGFDNMVRRRLNAVSLNIPDLELTSC